ncbi:MAG TPA: hypothetical protein VF794_27575 [Archangium sp.]|jgi:hypothetical protein|uniref:hypothetical protein n=1 Tax=Archangium sp. TaxID=1872627 RepID=UPI002ED87073
MSNSSIGSRLSAGLAAAQQAARRAAEAAQRAAEAAARRAAAQANAAQAAAQPAATKAAAAQAAPRVREVAQQHVAQLVEQVRAETAPVNLKGEADVGGVRHAGGLSPSELEAMLHDNKLPTYDVRGANRHMEGFRYAEEGAGTSLVDSIVAMELNGGRVDLGKDNALNCTQAAVVAQDYFNDQNPPVESEIVVGDEHAVLRMQDGRYYDPSRAILGEDPFLTPEQAEPYEGVDGVSVAEREEMAASSRQAMEALPPGASEAERRRAGTVAARREAGTLGSDGQAGEVSANQLANGFGWDDITDPIKDVAGAVAGGVADIVTDAGTFVADAGAGTIDFVGDVAEGGWNAVSDAVQIASEQGLKLTGELRTKARELARDGLLGPLNIGGNVNELGVGDKYTFAVGGEVSAGPSVEAAGEISIERTQENGQDTYTLEASLEVDIGLTIPGAQVSVGVGGKVEYQFDNPQDAARAAEIIAMAASAKAMGATPGFQPLSDAMMPGQEDMDFLNGHMSAVELSGDAAIGVAAEMGVGDAFGASGSAGVGGTLRVEFEGGQPSFVEIKAKAELEASGDLTVPLAGELGGDGLTATGGEIEGSAEVERTWRYPVKPGTTMGDLLSDPRGSIDGAQGQVSTKITLELSGSAGEGERGVKVEIDVSGIPPEELDGYLLEASRGNPYPLIQAVQGQPRTEERYVDRGFDEDPKLTIGGQGFELHVQSEIRDVEESSAS